MSINLSRRNFALRSAPCSVLAFALPFAAHPQPVLDVSRIVNGYSPGGSVDITCRKLAERLSGRWAKNVVVDNKSGAAGRLAIEFVKAAPADGSVMLIAPSSLLTMYPHIYKNLSYDVFADFAPVSSVAASAFALAVGPVVPASVRTIAEFVTWCKANPLLAQCGNAGAGSFPHFMAMLFARDAKIELSHVPFRGGGLAAQAVAAGHLAAVLSTESAAMALAQTGKLRILATTSPERSPFFLDASTFREAGYINLVQRERFVALMPAKTASAVVTLVSDAIRGALAEVSVQEVWRTAALHVDGSGPIELQSILRREYDFWQPIIKASGFTPEA